MVHALQNWKWIIFFKMVLMYKLLWNFGFESVNQYQSLPCDWFSNLKFLDYFGDKILHPNFRESAVYAWACSVLICFPTSNKPSCFPSNWRIERVILFDQQWLSYQNSNSMFIQENTILTNFSSILAFLQVMCGQVGQRKFKKLNGVFGFICFDIMCIFWSCFF